MLFHAHVPSEVGLLGGRGCAVNSSNEHRADTNGEGAHQDYKGNNKNIYYGFEAVVTNNHYAFMFYEVPTNKY